MSKNNGTTPTPHLLCIGHRGAMGHEPENTLGSIYRAIELGAPCVEIDVYLVDGHLVVIHDDTLERTTDGAGSLSEVSFDYLRTLDAGQGEQIPTLAEVCEAVQPHTCLNIELKGPGTAAPVVAHIESLVAQGMAYDAFLVSSFDHAALLEAASLNPEVLLGFLLDNDAAYPDEKSSAWPAFSIHMSRQHVNKARVAAAHERQQRVFVFTVNVPAEIERMQRLGVDGVFTNYPERVVERYNQGPTQRSWRLRSAQQ